MFARLAAVTAVTILTLAPTAALAENHETDEPSKVTICHVPPGNPEAAHEVEVSEEAWEDGQGEGHKSHEGDFVVSEEKPCPPVSEEPTEEPTEDPTEEPTEEPTDEPTEDPTEEPTDDPTEDPTEEPVEPVEPVEPREVVCHITHTTYALLAVDEQAKTAHLTHGHGLSVMGVEGATDLDHAWVACDELANPPRSDSPSKHVDVDVHVHEQPRVDRIEADRGQVDIPSGGVAAGGGELAYTGQPGWLPFAGAGLMAAAGGLFLVRRRWFT